MIVLVGLSHRTAPIRVREQLAVSAASVPGQLKELLSGGVVSEALIVSTCNRVEAVVVAPDTVPPETAIDAAVRSMLGPRNELASHLYRHRALDAVRHLFRVTASLDSLVGGEPQILGQVKSAYEQARSAGSVGRTLNRLMPRAIRAAKRVRTETGLGAGQISVPSVAVELAQQIFGDLSGRRVALRGSGEMGELAAKLLANAGAELIVRARNEESGGMLAERMGGSYRPLDQMSATLRDVDVVVTAPSASQPVILKSHVKAAIHRRRRGPLFLIDLAVPRDIDSSVESLREVFLYNVDDLSKIVAESKHSRQKEAVRAEEILGEELEEYERSASVAQVTPTVVALRDRMKQVLDWELERSLKSKLKHLGPVERDAVEQMLEAAVKRMMHTPSARLREIAADDSGDGEMQMNLEVLSDLFDLGSDEPVSHRASRAPSASPPSKKDDPQK